MEKIKNIFITLFSFIFTVSVFVFGFSIFNNQNPSEITKETLKNKVVVLYNKKDTKVNFINKKLEQFKKLYNVDYISVKYKDIEPLIIKETKDFKDLNKIQSIGQQISNNISSGKVKMPVDEIDQRFNAIVVARTNNQDSSKLEEELAEALNINKEDFKLYINVNLGLNNSLFQKEIKEEDLPLVLIMGEDKEINRINAIEINDLKMDWFLISKGILNLNKNETMKEVVNSVKNKEKIVVLFATNTCPYCQDTAPLAEEISKELNVKYVYVDLNANVNNKYYQDFIQAGYMEDVQGTPVIAVFKDGKLINKLEGQQNRTSIKKFIIENLK